MKKFIATALLICLAGGNSTVLAQTGSQPSAPSSGKVNQPTPVQPPQITLLSAGTGNRQMLRLKPAVGVKQLSLMTFDQTISMSMAGQAMPAVSVPLVTTTIETTVTKIDADGSIHYQFRYPEVNVVARPGAELGVFEQMRLQLQKLQDIRGTFVMSDRGQVLSTQFELPDQIDPLTRQLLQQMSQSADQLSFPLPAEAVAVGAKWQATRSLAIAGIQLTQTGTYELVDLKGNLATLKIAAEQQAPPQNVTPPGTSGNVQVRLKSLKTQGNGQSTLDLSKPFVQAATLSLQSATQVGTANPKAGQEFEMTAQTSVKITIQPK